MLPLPSTTALEIFSFYSTGTGCGNAAELTDVFEAKNMVCLRFVQ